MKPRNILLFVIIHLLSPSLIKRRLEYLVYRFTSKEVVRKINGVDMILTLEDRGISRQLLIYGKRETLTIEYLLGSGLLSEGDAVLDIGANIGFYALLESRLVGEQGIVYAVEPVSSNIQVLRRCLELNKCTNVETYQLAMGDKDGTITIHVSDQSNLSTIDREPSVNYIRDEQVGLMTVDTFLRDKKFPKLIRMDVEGYEYEIVKGMRKTLEGDSHLLIELHGFLMDNGQINELFDILIDSGYGIKYCVIDYLFNINKYANFFVKMTDEWDVPRVLDLDMAGLRQRILLGKSAHCLFHKSNGG